ncbi:MAG: hypothetical protein GTN69_09155 [Armatimonadetes bacterium]|nr:hypothetical protein [Armatimonadota bacterium]NIO76029.1 hypothetical protein [Armatimonadota bacterium]NIO97965.1 hypothetical protein [Armatimonadota bacterium]
MSAMGVIGMNLIIPYKEAAASVVDELPPFTRTFQAICGAGKGKQASSEVTKSLAGGTGRANLREKDCRMRPIHGRNRSRLRGDEKARQL